MDISVYSVSAVVLVGIIAEVVKRLGLNSKFIPLVSLITGVVVVCVGSWSFTPEFIFAGIVAGAIASGLYDNIAKGTKLFNGK